MVLTPEVAGYNEALAAITAADLLLLQKPEYRGLYFDLNDPEFTFTDDEQNVTRAIRGISRIERIYTFLYIPIIHANHETLSFVQSKDKLRLSYASENIARRLEQSAALKIIARVGKLATLD